MSDSSDQPNSTSVAGTAQATEPDEFARYLASRPILDGEVKRPEITDELRAKWKKQFAADQRGDDLLNNKANMAHPHHVWLSVIAEKFYANDYTDWRALKNELETEKYRVAGDRGRRRRRSEIKNLEDRLAEAAFNIFLEILYEQNNLKWKIKGSLSETHPLDDVPNYLLSQIQSVDLENIFYMARVIGIRGFLSIQFIPARYLNIRRNRSPMRV